MGSGQALCLGDVAPRNSVFGCHTLGRMAPREVIGGTAARRRRIERRVELVDAQEGVVTPESDAETAKADLEREKDTFLRAGCVQGGF